jgi:hypothetical protein
LPEGFRPGALATNKVMGSKMGAKITKKVAVKKGKKAISATRPRLAGGGKRNGSAASPPVRISLGGRDSEIKAAVLAMTASIAASNSELSKQLAASKAMLSEKMAVLSDRIGGLRRSIGEVVELVLLPGLMQKMNGKGHKYTISSPRKEFRRLDNSLLMEIDLLLENCDEVMAVEAKTLFTLADVEMHLERLKKLRDNEAITGVRGKTIYAGAAGMRFAEGVKQKIEENGIYLIKIDEDNDRVTIIPPAGSVKTW